MNTHPPTTNETDTRMAAIRAAEQAPLRQRALGLRSAAKAVIVAAQQEGARKQRETMLEVAEWLTVRAVKIDRDLDK